MLIRFDLSSGIEVYINGKSECTAPHPGAAFGAVRSANPLYVEESDLSVLGPFVLYTLYFNPLCILYIHLHYNMYTLYTYT